MRLVNNDFSNLTPVIESSKIKIDCLDLEPIKFKLVKEEGWSLEKSDAVEMEYRNFLWLNAVLPEECHVPNILVDEMWHTHILDTRKYMADCFAIFGFYLHHYPYLGLKDEQDLAKLNQMFAETGQRYSDILGLTPHVSEATGCGGGGCGGCGGGGDVGSGNSQTPSPSDDWGPASSCGSNGTENKKDKKKDKDKSKEPDKKKPASKGWWNRLGLSQKDDVVVRCFRSIDPTCPNINACPGREETQRLVSKKNYN